MSQYLKRCVSHLENVERYFRRPDVVLTYDGIPLDSRNNEFIKDLYVVMSCIWYDTSTSPGLLNERWAASLCSLDVRFVVDGFKAIDQRLITSDIDFASFNRWRRATYPSMGQILGPLKVEMEAFFTRKGSGLMKIRTCLLFITRANFPTPIGLEEEAFEKWSTRNLGDARVIDCEAECAELRRVFPRRKLLHANLRPKFGNGVSSDLGKATDLEAKYLAFKDDALLRYFASKAGFPTDALPYRKDGLERRGRLMFVPKALDKLRVVSPEPSSLMFYQRGVARWMLDLIEDSYWRSHIDLEHAELNAQLAQEGSISGEYATIDLSNASDGVKYQQVRALFHDTCLREALVSVRSRTVEYDGLVLSPNYYAPMGSGCCFEVETSFFASIVGAIMCQNRDRRAWRVYGDDIILPSDRYDQCVSRLVDFGFEINESKSYTGSSVFRESCGGEYYYGEDVTPIRISRRWRGLKPDHRSLPTILGNVDLANRLVDFPLARLRVIKDLKSIQPPPLFDNDGLKGIKSKCPSNFNARHRWNKNLQRDEYRTGTVVSPAERGSEDIAYYEWLRAKEVDHSPVAESITKVGPSKSPKWVPRWNSL